MRAVCTADCQYKGKFYSKGDRAEIRDGEPLPAHFVWPGQRAQETEGDPLPLFPGASVLVLGDAPSLVDDVQALHFPDDCRVIGVNLAPFRWQGRLDYWASLHGSLFHESAWLRIWARCPWSEGIVPHIITGRRFSGLNSGYSLVHCDRPGGSAYLALKAAQEMGFGKIFVAGIDAQTPAYAHFAQPLRHMAATLLRSGVAVHAASGVLKEG